MHNRPAPSLPRPALGDLSARANLSAARRRVLEVVEASNDAMTAVQVASALNLHHNTVREHLDALVDAGFVTVSTKPTGKRGRPALRYASTAPDPQQMVDAYLLLLDAIADTLGEGEDARATALEIGRRWAELTPGTIAEPTVDGEQVDRVTALIPYLAVMGFAPEVSGDTVVLRSCTRVSSGPSSAPTRPPTSVSSSCPTVLTAARSARLSPSTRSRTSRSSTPTSPERAAPTTSPVHHFKIARLRPRAQSPGAEAAFGGAASPGLRRPRFRR